MQPHLIERLICPRCGPESGLILLAEVTEERRVLEGRLGCAKCQQSYPVRGGAADLRLSGGEGSTPEPGVLPSAEESLRVAALLGVAEPHASVLLVGPLALHARGIRQVVPELQVVTIADALADWSDEPGVNRLLSDAPVLPFRARVFRAVGLSGDSAATLLDEAVRALAQGGRVVIESADVDDARLRAAGLAVLARDGATIVAQRS